MNGDGQSLSARKNVYESGGVVRRPKAEWTTSVHAFLRHLESTGFAGAPRVMDGGTEPWKLDSVQFIEGEVDPSRVWSEAAMYRLGLLMRELHAASASFKPSSDLVWQEWFMRSKDPSSIYSHCDAAPWNVVSREGLPVALIDWELSGPVDRSMELAHTAWLNARLFDDGVAEKERLSPAEERIQQLRAFVDGYELAREDRLGLVGQMIEVAILSAASDAIEAGITSESVDEQWIVWGVAWRARSAAWMIRNKSMLERAMS